MSAAAGLIMSHLPEPVKGKPLKRSQATRDRTRTGVRLVVKPPREQTQASQKF